jgi:hypothetical protein
LVVTTWINYSTQTRWRVPTNERSSTRSWAGAVVALAARFRLKFECHQGPLGQRRRSAGWCNVRRRAGSRGWAVLAAAVGRSASLAMVRHSGQFSPELTSVARRQRLCRSPLDRNGSCNREPRPASTCRLGWNKISWDTSLACRALPSC